MSFTESEIEIIADHIRAAGFELPQDWGADQIEQLASVIIDALDAFGAPHCGTCACDQTED